MSNVSKPPDEKPDERNQAVVEAVRDVFAPLLARLSPDVEPATIYVLALRPAISSLEGKDAG